MLPLPLDVVEPDALGASLLARARTAGAPELELGPREAALLAQMPWEHRRREWLAGRAVGKALLARRGFEPARVEILPRDSGAPAVFIDGAERPELFLSLSHTNAWVAAALADGPVGIDLCDDDDGPRLPRIASRVFSEGEAEACGAHRSPRHQAAVWALKEAALKLRIGGVFDPGAKSVRVLSLEPARLADPSLRVALYRLPNAALAVAREQPSRP